MELDPLYVDVAIRRWQVHSCEAASLLASGESFAQRGAHVRPSHELREVAHG
jgi:hypothetical protein